MRLRLIIVKNPNVPENVISLLIIPPPRPTIRLVAAAIIVILDTIRNVAPPFDEINSSVQGMIFSMFNGVSGASAPPCSAKLTELNNPPITKKKRKTFIIFRFNPLLVSDGCIAFSVIFNPYKKPITKAGIYRILIMIGFSMNTSAKNELRIIAISNAEQAPAAKIMKFEYLKNLVLSTSESFHEYTKITLIV